MSQENVEPVQAWFKRWNGGDRDFSTDELHPDFQVVSRLQAEPFEGREGLHRWMQEVDEHFWEWQHVKDARRDSGKLGKALQRDIEKAQQRMSPAPKAKSSGRTGAPRKAAARSTAKRTTSRSRAE